jgi:hypothetical protein
MGGLPDWDVRMVCVRKSLLHPTCNFGIHHSSTYENRFFFTLELYKTGQNHLLKLFWKIIVNYRKIIKWKINWILMSTSTQWTYNMIYLYIFYSYGEKHKSKVKKICTKAFHIVCSLRRTTNLKSNTIWFFILWFSVIYYDFLKLLQGWLCAVLESSGVKNPFS